MRKQLGWRVRGVMAVCLCVAVVAVVVVAMISYRQSVNGAVSTPGAGQGYFNAAVMDISEGEILVKCTESFIDEIPAGTEVIVSLDTVSGERVPFLQVGDNVRALHMGLDSEVSPVRTLRTVSIFMLDDYGEPVT